MGKLLCAIFLFNPESSGTRASTFSTRECTSPLSVSVRVQRVLRFTLRRTVYEPNQRIQRCEHAPLRTSLKSRDAPPALDRLGLFLESSVVQVYCTRSFIVTHSQLRSRTPIVHSRMAHKHSCLEESSNGDF